LPSGARPMFRLYKYLFPALAAALAFSYYMTAYNFRSLKIPLAEVLREPAQTAVKKGAPVTLEKGGTEYVLEPLFDYDISAAVIGTSGNYLSGIREIIPFDVGLMWGGTVGSGEFRKIRCSVLVNHLYIKWYGDAKINPYDLANTHIIPGSPKVLAALKTLVPGDQVRLRGQLVNVRAYPAGESGVGSPKQELLSSTTRKDQGDGACEILYVPSLEDVKVLRRADRFYPSLFHFCAWALPTLLAFFLVQVHLPFFVS